MTTTATAGAAGSESKNRGLASVQPPRRSLMLPIATLPAAGLLLRLGQSDLLGRFQAISGFARVLAAAGGAVFDFLPLIFAVGVAIGFARRADGSTALAAVVGFVVFSEVVQVYAPNKVPPVKTTSDLFRARHHAQPLALRRARRHPGRHHLGPAVASVSTASSCPVPGFLRWPPVRADHHGVRDGLRRLVVGWVYHWFNQALVSAGDAVTHSTIVGGGSTARSTGC